MNKKITALILILVFALTAFTACSEKNPEADTDTTAVQETEVTKESETEETTKKQKNSKKETETEETTEKKSDKKTDKKSDKKAEKETEKETEKTSEQTEDVLLVTYTEKTDSGKYSISLFRTSDGKYVLETADGKCTADEGAYNGCLNSYYAFDMGTYEGKGGNRNVHIMLDDGTYSDITDKGEEIANGFLSIRNILTSFDANAPAVEGPADAAG